MRLTAAALAAAACTRDRREGRAREARCRPCCRSGALHGPCGIPSRVGYLALWGYHCRLECVCHVGYRAVWDSQAKISKLEAAAAALQLRHEEEMISLRDEHAVALSAARASATAEATRGAGALAVRVSTRSECSVGQGLVGARWCPVCRRLWMLLGGIRMTMDGRSRLLRACTHRRRRG